MIVQLVIKKRDHVEPPPHGDQFPSYFCQRTAIVGATDTRGLVWEIDELTKWQQAIFAVLEEATSICREYADRLQALDNELAEETGRRVQRLDALLQDSSSSSAVAGRGESASNQ